MTVLRVDDRCVWVCVCGGGGGGGVESLEREGASSRSHSHLALLNGLPTPAVSLLPKHVPDVHDHHHEDWERERIGARRGNKESGHHVKQNVATRAFVRMENR